MSRKIENEQELQEFRQQLKPFVVDESINDRPFFAKKVMRAIANLEAKDPQSVYKQTIYLYLRIALFMGLLLFPTLTEAII